MAADTFATVARRSLTVLADRMPRYWEHIRNAGFECSHAINDWIARSCSHADKELHYKFLVEYAKEALIADDPSEIIYSDEAHLQSEWLSERKAVRRRLYGEANELSEPGRQHLLQLSPCLQEVIRARSSLEVSDVNEISRQLHDIRTRRNLELKLHERSVSRLRMSIGFPDSANLRLAMTKPMIDRLPAFNVEAMMLRDQSIGRDLQAPVLVAEIQAPHVLVLVPVVARTNLEAESGSLGVAFRLMKAESLKATQFDFQRDVNLCLQEVLPNRLSEYGQFDTVDGACLNMLAWSVAASMIANDALSVLRELDI